MIYNLFTSAEVGRVAGSNPWRSRSPEWQIPSPVPEHSYTGPDRGGGRALRLWPEDSTYVSMAAVGDD